MTVSGCIDHGKNLGKDTYANKWAPTIGKVTTLHRIVYCNHNKIPIENIVGLVVRHTCDNRRCINPEHLLIGTYKQNTADMWERNRNVILFGENASLAKLAAEDANKIRELYIPRHKEFGARALARLYGVAHPQILNIVKGKSYNGPSNSECPTRAQ